MARSGISRNDQTPIQVLNIVAKLDELGEKELSKEQTMLWRRMNEPCNDPRATIIRNSTDDTKCDKLCVLRPGDDGYDDLEYSPIALSYSAIEHFDYYVYDVLYGLGGHELTKRALAARLSDPSSTDISYREMLHADMTCRYEIDEYFGLIGKAQFMNWNLIMPIGDLVADALNYIGKRSGQDLKVSSYKKPRENAKYHGQWYMQACDARKRSTDEPDRHILLVYLSNDDRNNSCRFDMRLTDAGAEAVPLPLYRPIWSYDWRKEIDDMFASFEPFDVNGVKAAKLLEALAA